MQVDAGEAPGLEKRSKRRRNVVGSSPHRDEYVRLIKAGWSSISLERYAAFRFGEDIPSRTFRAYKSRLKLDQVDEKKTLEQFATTEAHDVLQKRAALISLQEQRVVIDTSLELGMNKLLSTTREEIRLLHSMLGDHLADLQTLGVMPKEAQHVQVTATGGAEPEGAGIPAHRSLAEIFGADPAAEAEIAKVIHMQRKKTG